MITSLVLSIMIALGAAGNFGDTPGLNGGDMQTDAGINPVQHSEGATPPQAGTNPGINPVQHSE